MEALDFVVGLSGSCFVEVVGKGLLVNRLFLAQEVDDPGVHQEAQVAAEAAFGSIVAELALGKKVSDYLSDHFFDESVRRVVSASMKAIARPSGGGEWFMVKFEKSFPRHIPVVAIV